MNNSIVRVLTWAGALTLWTASIASATPTSLLDFGIQAGGGSVKYTTIGGVLTATGIGVGNLVPEDSSMLATGPTLTCNNCVLTFTTGALTSTTTTPIKTWNFGAGGTDSITLTGWIDLNNDHVLDAGDAGFGGTPLLTGTLSDANVQAFMGTNKIVASDFIDIKDPNLVAFFFPGLATNTPFEGFLNLSFNAPGAPPHTFISTGIGSGDIQNTPTVPEPGTLMLLGSGLSGFGYLTLRRRRKSS